MGRLRTIGDWSVHHSVRSLGIVLAIVVVIVAVPAALLVRSLDSAKTLAEVGKNFFEAVAWLSAGLFFGYKALSGYLITNISMKVDCERRAKPESQVDDYLLITITLTKGDKGTVQLHDAQARIGTPTGYLAPLFFVGVNRRSFGSERIELEDAG